MIWLATCPSKKSSFNHLNSSFFSRIFHSSAESLLLSKLVNHPIFTILIRLRETPLQPTYSFQTINKPNCNPSFITTLSLRPIDLVLPIGFNSFTTSAAFSSKGKANQEQQPSQQPSDSNSLLIFQLSNGTSINVDQSNLISVLNHLELLIYSQNRDQYRTGQPLLQSKYSFHKLTTPNQNTSFVAKISLPPIDSLPRQVRKELNYALVCLSKTMQQPDSHGPPTKRPSSSIQHSQGLLNTKKTKLVKSSGATPSMAASNTRTH
ncbi:hypothetical protein O181_122329 [Austropuccinia psidii MF-1]|uniref:Uncharacterized protein n=1 Tax=Austropuccinia psidii MF-1 TaxID=1389203 RepID=A0A9Q3KKB6_9BASI|nr:hypothetical protein [Austropuccinia psidii MF-1]